MEGGKNGLEMKREGGEEEKKGRRVVLSGAILLWATNLKLANTES